MLKTKKPDIDAFISGAKADAATAAKPAKAPAKGKGAAAKAKGTGRGKAPSKYMATLDDPMSRYQLRIPRQLHSEVKSAAALASMPLCDYILEAVVQRMERDKKTRG